MMCRSYRTFFNEWQNPNSIFNLTLCRKTAKSRNSVDTCRHMQKALDDLEKCALSVGRILASSATSSSPDDNPSAKRRTVPADNGASRGVVKPDLVSDLR